MVGRCLAAWGQWAVQILQYTASLLGGSGQCSSCNELPHCLGQWAVQLLQHSASLPVGSGQCNSCIAKVALRECIANDPLPTAPRQ